MKRILENRHIKLLSDFGVVGVGLAQPGSMLRSELSPDPVSQVTVEQAAGVEAVALLYHHLRITSLHHPAGQQVHRGEVVVYHLEIAEGGGVYDLLVDCREFSGSLSSHLSVSLVAVEPTEAGANLEAVEEVVEGGVRDVQRMLIVVEVVVQNFTLG